MVLHCKHVLKIKGIHFNNLSFHKFILKFYYNSDKQIWICFKVYWSKHLSIIHLGLIKKKINKLVTFPDREQLLGSLRYLKAMCVEQPSYKHWGKIIELFHCYLNFNRESTTRYMWLAGKFLLCPIGSRIGWTAPTTYPLL